MVIFGASGDLTKRKLIPALYNLAKDNLLSKEFALVGFARNEMNSEQFRDMISEEIEHFATTKVDPDLWHWLARRIYYVSGDFDDPQVYQKTEPSCWARWTRSMARAATIFTISPRRPSFFATVVKQLGAGRAGQGRTRAGGA